MPIPSNILLGLITGYFLCSSSFAQDAPVETPSKIDPGVLVLLLASKSSEVYTVTTLAGSGGVVSPAGSIESNEGDIVEVLITPEWNYELEGVSGTCGGTLKDSTFSTDPIVKDCTVDVVFKSLPEPGPVDIYFIDSGYGDPGLIDDNTGAVLFSDVIKFNKYIRRTTTSCNWYIYDPGTGPEKVEDCSNDEHDTNDSALLRANQMGPICKVGDQFVPKSGYYKLTRTTPPENFNSSCISCSQIQTTESIFSLTSAGILTIEEAQIYDSDVYSDQGTFKQLSEHDQAYTTNTIIDLNNKTFIATESLVMDFYNHAREYNEGTTGEPSGQYSRSNGSGSGEVHGLKGDYKGNTYDFDEFLVFSETLDHVPPECLSVSTIIDE